MARIGRTSLALRVGLSLGFLAAWLTGSAGRFQDGLSAAEVVAVRQAPVDGSGLKSTNVAGRVPEKAPGKPASERPATNSVEKSLVVLGDSLSAGFGLDPGEAWPTRLQEMIRTAGLPWKVVNAGVSGDTSAGGLRRLDWILRRPVDGLLIELGGNDGLRGLPLEATRTNLQAVIERTRAKFPEARIVLAGMKMPENFGEAYTRQFETLYRDLAEKHAVALIPFLLEGVGGRPELNLPDQIHPNAEGHRRVATNVWNVLRPVLQPR